MIRVGRAGLLLVIALRFVGVPENGMLFVVSGTVSFALCGWVERSGWLAGAERAVGRSGWVVYVALVGFALLGAAAFSITPSDALWWVGMGAAVPFVVLLFVWGERERRRYERRFRRRGQTPDVSEPPGR